MESDKQWFHNDNNGLHLLFKPLSLDENSELVTGYICISILCGLERWITYWLDYKLNKVEIDSTMQRINHVIIRTIMYGMATTLRLLYMLVVMYFNTGLFITVVSSLTLSQLVIELLKSSSHNKTGPLKKFQNKGYSDLSTVAETNRMDDEDDDYDNNTQTKEYNHIPKIVISGEI